LLDPASFLLAVTAEIVGVRRSPLAPRRLVSGRQFEIAHLPGVQRRARPQIAFAFAQQMPDQDGKLAGGRDGGDVLAPPKARSGPGTRAAAQAASTSMPRACPRPCLVIRPW
jgi:hypothetical protein